MLPFLSILLNLKPWVKPPHLFWEAQHHLTNLPFHLPTKNNFETKKSIEHHTMIVRNLDTMFFTVSLIIEGTTEKSIVSFDATEINLEQVYDNKYSSIIDIYFYATFSTQTSSACAPKTFLDTLSDVLDKCWHISLIKIESVSETQAKPRLVSFSCLLYIFFY
jgi:hypothetical protein